MLLAMLMIFPRRCFTIAARTRLDHPLFAPPCPHRIRTSYFTSQDDVSHPDSECELVLRGGLGVETRDLGDESVRYVDRHLRISPLWQLARRIRIVLHSM